MSKESLDYQKLCLNYYSSWEEGCCMESCEFYNHNECPVVYVNGLIADLEAKLAESEELNKKLLLEKCDCLKLVCDYEEEDRKLKQQLAEKENRIKKLNIEAQKYFEDAYCNDFHNQDKISFAVEQLEKVKELLYPELRFDYSLYLRVMHEIDNQIKQLKEGK